jgi:hypothetical protein
MGGDGGSVRSLSNSGGGGDVLVSIVTGLRGNVTINADSFILNRISKHETQEINKRTSRIRLVREHFLFSPKTFLTL